MYHVEASTGRSQTPDVTVFQPALAGDGGEGGGRLTAPSGTQLWIQNKCSCCEREGNHTLGLCQLLRAQASHRKTSLIWGVLLVK